MNKYELSAQKALTLSPVMEGREKIETDALIGGTYTLDEFDFVTIPDKKKNDGSTVTYACVHFVELPDKFYNAGALIRKMCEMWTEMNDGDIEAASADLKFEGGCKFKFEKSKTSSGNNLTLISVAR